MIVIVILKSLWFLHCLRLVIAYFQIKSPFKLCGEGIDEESDEEGSIEEDITTTRSPQKDIAEDNVLEEDIAGSNTLQIDVYVECTVKYVSQNFITVNPFTGEEILINNTIDENIVG